MTRNLRLLPVAAVLLWGSLLCAPARGAETSAPPRFDLGERVRGLLDGLNGALAARSVEDAADPDASGLDAARTLYMRGKYDKATERYRKLLDDAGTRVAASIGLADAYAMEGKYAKALDAVSTLSEDPAAVADADWQVAMAEHARRVGQYETALEHAAAARKLREDWAPAILVHGRLLETVGKRDKAVDVYETMEKVVAGEAYRRDPRSLVALGAILDRHAHLSGRKASEQANNILNNYFREVVLNVDETYWPANVAAGMFLLSKHRPATAAAEFKEAASKNKRIPEVYIGRAALLLERWQFEAAIKELKKALKINPNHPDAHIIRGVCLLQWRKFDEVEKHIKKALEVNPNHIEALSLLAALHHRTFEPEKAKPYARRVAKVNPNCVQLPLAIAEWLSAGRQFTAAEKHYLEAMKRDPLNAEVVTGLGKLYMQTGDEDKARSILKKAHKLDDFRADVVNYLNLLEKMDDYAVRETDHFVVKLDPRYDKVLLDQLPAYLEKIHGEICGDFDYTPERKTVVEVMPSHQTFSIRIAGRGWIGTVGACTGRVIAIAAPDPDRSQFGLHHWATVLRHEYTHTVTLAATRNRIPHWFTEACAVWQQPDKRNYRFVKMLVGATRTGRLFPVKELDWGFIRPKRRGDRTLAYAQAGWTIEYIIEAHGYETIVKMLRGFRNGLTQAEVFTKVVGVKQKDFDKGFRKWAARRIAEWGYTAEAPPKLGDAAKTAKANPDDADAQATHAVALYYARKLKNAEKVARKALKIDPAHPKALAVLATVLANDKKEWSEALETARKLEQVNPDSVTAPRTIAKVSLKQRKYSKAISALERLQQRQPFDPYSYEQLATLYQQMGLPEKALPNLVHLHQHTMNDPKYARQIAEILQATDKPEQALTYYEQITHINPYESTAHEKMASIHLRARRFDEAEKFATNVTFLEPESARAWLMLSVVQFRIGRASNDDEKLQQARDAAEKALKLDPQSQADRLLDAINAEIKG